MMLVQSQASPGVMRFPDPQQVQQQQPLYQQQQQQPSPLYQPQFGYAPPPLQSQMQTQAAPQQQSFSETSASVGSGSATGESSESVHRFPVTFVVDSSTAKVTAVKPLVNGMRKLGYDTSKPIHITGVRVMSSHSTLPTPLPASFKGLNGNESHVASPNHGNADLDGNSHSFIVAPNTHYLDQYHGTVYSQPLTGDYSDTNEHAKVDVSAMRKTLTPVAGSAYVSVYPASAPDMSRLIEGSRSLVPSLQQQSTPDGVQYYTLTHEDAHRLLDSYDKAVGSQFVRTTPDKHTVTLQHFGAPNEHFGQQIAELPGQTRSQRDSNASGQTKHAVTLDVEYRFIHPDGPKSSSSSSSSSSTSSSSVSSNTSTSNSSSAKK